MNDIMCEKKRGAMSKKTMIGYGAPGWATLFTFTMFTTYGLYFFTDVVGLAASFAGLIMTIGTLWDAFTDPVVGMISDKTDPVKGRRRPYMFWVAIPFGIVTWLLFTDFGFDGTMSKVYFIIVAILFYTAQTVLDIPYTALAGEITEDYDERSTLGSVRIVWALAACIFGGGVMYFTSLLEPLTGSMKSAWSVCFAIFGLLCTISIFIGWKATDGYENKEAIVSDKISWRLIREGPLKNKSFLHVAGGFIFGIMAQCVFLGTMVYYFSYNLSLNDGQIATVNTLMWIIGLLWVYPVNWMSIHWSKKISWSVSFGLWGACMILFPLVFNVPGKVVAPVVMCGILVVGLNALYQVVYALIPDCVEVDELKTGDRKEGIFYSSATVSQKVASAITVSIIGMILGAIGYDAGGVQTEETLNGIFWLFVGGTTICCLISVLFMVTNPLNKKRHAEVVKALEGKKAGKEINLEDFKDLINL